MTTAPANVTGNYVPGEMEPPSHSSFTTAVLVAMAVIIFVENSVVCFLFVANKKLRTTTNIFVVSLAISDLLVAILFVPVYLGTSVGHQVNVYIVTFLLFSSLFNLCGVTYDRYHAILQPLTYMVVFTYRRITLVLLCTWVLPLLLIALPLTWSYRDLEFIIKISRVYLGILVSIPLFTYVFIAKVYYSIFKAIKRQMKMTLHLKVMFTQLDPLSSSNSFETKPSFLNVENHNVVDIPPESPQICRFDDTKSLTTENLPAKYLRKQRFKKYSEKVLNDIRAAKLFAFIILIFIIFWLPVVFINLMVALDKVAFIPPFIYDVSVYSFVANALINPLIYTFYKSDYRCALLELIGLKKKRKKFDVISLEELDRIR